MSSLWWGRLESAAVHSIQLRFYLRNVNIYILAVGIISVHLRMKFDCDFFNRELLYYYYLFPPGLLCLAAEMDARCGWHYL